MEMTTEKPEGVYPQALANLIGVHLRTVFRWASKGYLKLNNGTISKEEVEKLVEDRYNSVPLRVALKSLGISYGTLRIWRKKGSLATITVMGEERVSRESVEKPPIKKQKGPIGKPGYFGFNKMINVAKSSYIMLNTHLKDVNYEIDNGRKLFTISEVARVESLLNSSITVLEASRILGIAKCTVRRLVNQGKMDKFSFLGVTRINLKSIERYKKNLRSKLQEKKTESDQEKRIKKLTQKRRTKGIKTARSEAKAKLIADRKALRQKHKDEIKAKAEEKKQLRLLERENVTRLREEAKALVLEKKRLIQLAKLEKQQALKLSKLAIMAEPKAPTKKKSHVAETFIPQIPDYEPKLLVKVVMGRKCNVTTLEEASKTMGVSKDEVSQLMTAGAIRYCHYGDKRFPYIASVKAWAERAKQNN